MRLYVETDFLIALLKPDDWLRAQAEATLERHESVYTSLLAYVELLVEAYEPGEGIDYDVSNVVANLLEVVPLRPTADEDVVLAAATYLDEHDVTPFDAFHAGVAVTNDDRIHATDRVYEELGLDRIPLEPEGG